MEEVLDHICRLLADDVMAVLNSTLSLPRMEDGTKRVNGWIEFWLL